MTKSITEHSRKVKAEFAAKWNKQQLAQGKVKRMTVQLERADFDEFDAICAELGLSRPQAIKALCAFYREHC